jgi:hypothetical protein
MQRVAGGSVLPLPLLTSAGGMPHHTTIADCPTNTLVHKLDIVQHGIALHRFVERNGRNRRCLRGN